jgi:hypothetical protein
MPFVTGVLKPVPVSGPGPVPVPAVHTITARCGYQATAHQICGGWSARRRYASPENIDPLAAG